MQQTIKTNLRRKKNAGKRKSIEQDTDLTLYIVIGAGAAGMVLLCLVVIKICGVTGKEVSKTDGAFERELTHTAHGELEAQYRPTNDDEAKKKKPRWYQVRVAPAGMPGLPVSAAEVDTQPKKKDTAAFQHLRRLTMHIKKRGSISGDAQQRELEEAVARAEGQVTAELGPDDAGDLISQGRKQLALLATERSLTAHTKATDGDLTAVSTDYLPARPGGKTVADQDEYRAAQTEAWQRLDTLRLATVNAQHAGANPVLLDRAEVRVAQFVGRTVELPEQRCILDPEGKGLRILQPGIQRATDPYSGEAYTWDERTYSACYTVPRDGLGEVDTDAARPLCAAFAQNGHCSLGMRCAWRHAKQQPGDRLREPIQLKE